VTVSRAARVTLGDIAAGLSGALLVTLAVWALVLLAFEPAHARPNADALPRGLTEPAHARPNADALPRGLTVEDRHGHARNLDDVFPRSKRLLVFWRIDSKPSREALIHLHQNRHRLSKRNIFVVGISPSERSAAATFLQTQGIGFENLYDPGGKVASALGLGYVYPSLALLDEKDNVLGRTEGGGESFDIQFSRLLCACDAGKDGGGWIWIVGSALAGAALLTLVLGR